MAVNLTLSLLTPEQDNAICAAVAATEAVSEETLIHYDGIVAAATYYSEGLNYLQDTTLFG